MAYTNIALSKFITQDKNDALPNSQGLNSVGFGPLKADASGVVSAITPSATTGYVLTSVGTSADPVWSPCPIYCGIAAIGTTTNPTITISGLTGITSTAVIVATMSYTTTVPSGGAKICPVSVQSYTSTSFDVQVQGAPSAGANICWAVLKR